MARVTIHSDLKQIARQMETRVAQAEQKTLEDVARRMRSRGSKNFGDKSGLTRASIRIVPPERKVIMFGAAPFVEYGAYRPGPPNRGRMPAFSPERRAAKNARFGHTKRVTAALQP